MAENLCYTALRKFRDKYGEIPNVSDKDFFDGVTIDDIMLLDFMIG